MKDFFLGLLVIPAMFLTGIVFLGVAIASIGLFSFIYDILLSPGKDKKTEEKQAKEKTEKDSPQELPKIKPVSEPDFSDELIDSNPGYYTNEETCILLGEIYERYIGQTLEAQGFSVEYNGINKGKEDSGVDLIASKDGITAFVQCKNWSVRQTIHEKYIYQLHGAVDEERRSGNTRCIGIFCCTCAASDRAKTAAQKLGILLKDHYQMSKEYWQQNNPFN